MEARREFSKLTLEDFIRITVAITFVAIVSNTGKLIRKL
jgi:hypothetical protein